jgi:hypothetical protein
MYLLFIISIALTQALGDVLVFQNGRELTTTAGISKIYRYSTDTSISTQYLASWNNNNGNDP